MSDESSNPLRDEIQKAIDRERGDPVHEGHAGRSPRAASRPGRWRPCRRSGTPFAAVDILPDPRIRQELSALSNWPTIPQLFVDGELVGGADIVAEMYESGELAETLGVEPPARPSRGARGRRRPRRRR